MCELIKIKEYIERVFWGVLGCFVLCPACPSEGLLSVLLLVDQRQDRIDLVFQRPLSTVRFDEGLDAHVVDDAVVGVAQGRHEELVPEGRPVRLIIEQTAGGVRAVGDGGADDVHRLGAGAGSLQEPTVASQYLLLGVAGQIVKAFAGVNDGIVRQSGIGQHEILLSRGERSNQREIGGSKLGPLPWGTGESLPLSLSLFL
mmetsp:Transcript_9284/g.20523  ORF Transcript_9284/g.20523 Transcript_9284/m.20523 type:complete len:201 (-) Transcript_9284:875-1477(-)